MTTALVFALALAAPSIHDGSFTAPDGSRTLEQSIDIKGSAACVWRQFTGEGEIKATGVPMAHVELKPGGVIDEGLTPDAKPGGADNIRHQVIAYLPERLLVLRNQSVPKGLPGADLYPSIVQVISIVPTAEGGVRLTLAHTGYGKGEGFDGLYRFFHDHNPRFLAGAKARCEKTPG